MLCVFITIKKKSYLWSQGKNCRGKSNTTFELCKYIIELPNKTNKQIHMKDLGISPWVTFIIWFLSICKYYFILFQYYKSTFINSRLIKSPHTRILSSNG